MHEQPRLQAKEFISHPLSVLSQLAYGRPSRLLVQRSPRSGMDGPGAGERQLVPEWSYKVRYLTGLLGLDANRSTVVRDSSSLFHIVFLG